MDPKSIAELKKELSPFRLPMRDLLNVYDYFKAMGVRSSSFTGAEHLSPEFVLLKA